MLGEVTLGNFDARCLYFTLSSFLLPEWKRHPPVPGRQSSTLGWRNAEPEAAWLPESEGVETHQLCLALLSLRDEPKPPEWAAGSPQMSNAVSKPVFQFLNQCFMYNPTFRNLPLTGLEEEVLLVRIGFRALQICPFHNTYVCICLQRLYFQFMCWNSKRRRGKGDRASRAGWMPGTLEPSGRTLTSGGVVSVEGSGHVHPGHPYEHTVEVWAPSDRSEMLVEWMDSRSSHKRSLFLRELLVPDYSL